MWGVLGQELVTPCWYTRENDGPQACYRLGELCQGCVLGLQLSSSACDPDPDGAPIWRPTDRELCCLVRLDLDWWVFDGVEGS